MAQHEQSEALDRLLTSAQRQRAFAKLRAAGWQSGNPIPHHIWQSVAIQAICEDGEDRAAQREAAYRPDRWR